MKRREFIRLVGGAAASWPLAVRAQQPVKMKRVAMIHQAMKPDDMKIGGDRIYATILEEMKRLGYVEGVNLFVDRYSAEGRPDSYQEIIRKAVATRPDAIFAVGNPLVLAVHADTRAIPVVACTGYPIAIAIIQSLARPVGNIT